MIHTHPNDPPLTVMEAGRIARITASAVIHGGQYTTAQKRTIDRILDRAKKRQVEATKK